MPDILASCYRHALAIAESQGLQSIAFPLLGAGVLGWPTDIALDTAVQAIRGFLHTSEMTVYLVVFDRKAFHLSDERYQNVTSYLEEHYVDHALENEYRIDDEAYGPDHRRRLYRQGTEPAHPKTFLQSELNQLGETFSETLFRWIDDRGLSDPEVYKRANIDRRLFSKIRSHKDYQPRKETVLAISIAMKLNLAETQELLSHAGYTLSNGNHRDVVVRYFIESQNYDIFDVNDTLYITHIHV